MRLPFFAATDKVFADQGANCPGAAQLLRVGAIVVEYVVLAVRLALLVDEFYRIVEIVHAESLALELDVVHLVRDFVSGRRD